MLEPPNLKDVIDAGRRIAPYIHRTPIRQYPALGRLVGPGTELWVKHENYQVLGSFKPRGGINLVSQLGSDEQSRGLVAASTGNHGQSVAFAGKTFGASVTIVVPNVANPGKLQSMKDLGATVIQHGDLFDESHDFSIQMAADNGARHVHSANEPDLIAGVGTYSLEIFEDLADIDVMIVPVGAGSGASGAAIVTDAVSPSTEVIVVQAEAAPSAFRSWESDTLIEAPMATAAEGLATAHSYELPIGILRERVNTFVLVSEEEIRQAIVSYLEHARTLVEGAGAVSLAAAIKLKDRLAGKRVVVVASGGNLSMAHLREALAG
ncbi:MAG TPA: threonine/serine dehydratase [Dehalococcoidia bacterium]|nr:threonine ammonia-lyase [Chloroflexota bacterium]MDP5876079.1 threonine/serine dehydratase [Dehalococcoidia bacterium]MDP6272827.1 threonine/serine dehydratase [Dehalococcoidia bacterium]MDP7160621.1 threonine/serine dehydratase [Dehalococcoidia bacterium]MDP7213667.1 threonine/serine dehydratase [Dehalococcoidia bacterium]